MSDFLTRLASRTLGLGARVVPDVSVELAAGASSMPAAESESPRTLPRPSLAHVAAHEPSPRRESDSDDADTHVATRRTETTSLDAATPFMPSIHTEARDTVAMPASTTGMAGPRFEEGPKHAQSASHDDVVRGASRPSNEFRPLVQQEVVVAPLTRSDRDEAHVAARRPLRRPARPAEAVTGSSRPTESDETGHAVRGPSRAAREMPFAEPAPERAGAERADEAVADSREPTTVRITIGRIEVRANAPAARAEAPGKATRERRGISLDDYLKQRSGL